MRSPTGTSSRLSRWATIALVVVPMLAFVAWDARAVDFTEPRVGAAAWDRWLELSAELDELRSTPLGLVPLEELERHTRWVPFPTIADAVEAVVEAEDSDPIVRASAAHRQARAYLARGDLEANIAAIEAEGYLTDWSVMGPLSNESMSGFDRAFGPESARDQTATEQGRVGEVSWRDVSGLSRNGYLDLARLAHPARPSVVYAVTQVESPRRLRARLWTAVDGAYKIWLNGAPVAALDTDLGGGPVREWWDVELRRGTNELVVKAAGEEGPLGFYVRLTDRQGRPFTGLSSSPEVVPNSTPLAPVDLAAHSPSGSILQTFDELFFGETSSAEAVGDDPELESARRAESLIGAALVLKRSLAHDPSEPWRRYLLEGGTCLEGSPRVLARCAQVQEHYWERHRSLTLAVSELSPDDAMRDWVEFELADLAYSAIGESSVDEVRSRCSDILARRPDFVPALLLIARLWEDAAQPYRALSVVTSALELAPDSPEVLHETNWTRRRSGQTPEITAFDERVLEMAWDNPSNVLSLAPTLASSGHRDEALTILDRAIEIQPLSLALYRVRANLLSSVGDAAGAEATLRAAIALSPTNTRAWEELGRLLIREGNLDAATEALDVVLSVEPQNQEMALLRRRIGSEERPFYEEYLLTLDDIRALEPNEELVGDRDWYYLAQQQITHVHANGLGTKLVQEAYQVQTRAGAETLRHYQIDFVPDDEVVELLSARIVKPDGTVLESFQRWEENLSQPWYGLYYDVRALVLGFEDLAPGDILEVAYTLSNTRSENMFADYFGELFYVQGFQPKGLVRYGVIHPPEIELNMRAPQLEHALTQEEGPLGVNEIFELRDVPRIEWETSMPGLSELADYIHVSTFEDWSNVADWYWNLIHDQLATSPEIESTVAELLEGLETLEEQVSAIHEYVVRNTRYVGLEFGIHGFRPYRTTVIFARRFGDCKDTASLIKVMLGVAGIDSELVLVRTRDQGVIGEQPPSLAVFNHVIAYVPELDLYLDGTAGHSGLDELPYADQGASALLVGDDGSFQFLELPVLPAASSRLEQSFVVDLSQTGAPTAVSMVATGQFAAPLRRRYEAEENRQEDFQRDFAAEYPGARIGEIAFSGLADINEPPTITFDFEGVSWLRGSEERWLLYPLGIETNISSRLAGVAARVQPLELEFPFQNHYQLEFVLPPGLAVVEGSEQSWQEESPFGRFSMSLEQIDDRILIDVELEILEISISADDYPNFRDFIQRVEQTINRQVVLAGRSNG